MDEARLRSERDLLVILAQDAEQPPHLGERAARRCDSIASIAPRASSGRRSLERVARAARLEHDHLDRVRDDVVELARDPRPLLGHRRAGPLVALLDEEPLALAPDPDDDAGEERPDRRRSRRRGGR